MAGLNGITENLFKKDVKQWLTADIWNDSLLGQDFRAAMLKLCLNCFEPDLTDQGPVIQWLQGDLPKISAVRDEDIFSKITRDNARAMLASLCRWLAKSGSNGLLVFVDISQLARKGAEAVGGLNYTKASVMDAYEVLRQIIDDAEHYQRFAFVAAGTPDLIDGHEDRVISGYQALQMRIGNDVRTSGRDNPLAPLVRLTQGMEAPRHAAPSKRSALAFPTKRRWRLLKPRKPGSAIAFAWLSMRASAYGNLATAPGLLISGGFGAGKSHLLGHLRLQALANNFVVSQVSISKETALYDLTRDGGIGEARQHGAAPRNTRGGRRKGARVLAVHA